MRPDRVPNGTAPGRRIAGGRSGGRAAGGNRGRGRRRSAGTAPRRSELRRSGDYSGPSCCSRRLSLRRGARPFGVVPRAVPCTRWTTLLAVSTRTQRDAVTSRAAPLAILAGAGSGKTRVLTRRIAWQSREGIDRSAPRARGHVHPQGGGRAAHPPRRGSACEHAVTAGTFHAIALAQLRRRADEQGRTMPDAARAQGARPRAAPRRRGREAGARAPPSSRPRSSGRRHASSRPTATSSAVARRRARTPRARRPRSPTIYRDVRAREAPARPRRLRRPHRRAAPTRSSATPSSRPRSAGGSATSSSTSSRTPAPAQFRLLRAWLGDRSDLCVVGDADQAIYGVRRRRPVVPRAASRRQFPPERFPDVGVVRLGSNYRSHAAGRRGRRRGARAPRRRRTAVHAAQPDGPLPIVTAYDTDDDEARGVARALRARARRRDLPWSRIAVLYRVNAQSALFEEALSRAGVPFRVRGGGAVPRPARGARSRSTSCAQSARTAPEPTVRRAPHRPRRRRATSSSEERREHADALVRLGHEYLEAERRPRHRVDGFLDVPADGAARRRRRRRPAATPSSCSRSTGPRASSSTPCSSPGSSAASCRSPTPRRRRRSTRSSACSTSR